MVPANWEHPKYGHTLSGEMGLQPMYDEEFDEAFEGWLANFDRIRRGELTDFEKKCYPRGLADWLQGEIAPDPSYYRPWSEKDATWYQLWETVSEGTPVTPPFPTKEELVEYLVANGDFLDQDRWRRGDRFTL